MGVDAMYELLIKTSRRPVKREEFGISMTLP
jgi:hypothetical protein